MNPYLEQYYGKFGKSFVDQGKYVTLKFEWTDIIDYDYVRGVINMLE